MAVSRQHAPQKQAKHPSTPSQCEGGSSQFSYAEPGLGPCALFPASLFPRFSPLETGWLAQLLIPGMRRSFSKTGADPGDQLLGPRDQLLFLVRGSAPEIRAPPFPIGPPRLPTAPACCPAQGPASAGKPHVKSARREREFAPLCDRLYCPRRAARVQLPSILDQ